MICFLIPGPVRGKGRPRFARRGAFVTTHTDEKTESYESMVKVLAQQAMAGADLLDGALEVLIQATKAPPKSMSNKKRAAALAHKSFPTGKPDCDNIAKIVCDAMNRIVYTDDSQVVRLSVEKFYGDCEGVLVIVQPLDVD